jgi:hypothetical protein
MLSNDVLEVVRCLRPPMSKLAPSYQAARMRSRQRSALRTMATPVYAGRMQSEPLNLRATWELICNLHP